MRMDYSISCGSLEHTSAIVWASVMILVYPIGVPALYFFMLYRVRSVRTA